MKRYKLLKDLPTFMAGDIFELRSDGCLWLAKSHKGENHWEDEVMAYHRRTLEHFPNILKDWFMEITSTKAEEIRELFEELKNEIDEYLEGDWL